MHTRLIALLLAPIAVAALAACGPERTHLTNNGEIEDVTVTGSASPTPVTAATSTPSPTPTPTAVALIPAGTVDKATFAEQVTVRLDQFRSQTSDHDLTASQSVAFFDGTTNTVTTLEGRRNPSGAVWVEQRTSTGGHPVMNRCPQPTECYTSMDDGTSWTTAAPTLDTSALFADRTIFDPSRFSSDAVFTIDGDTYRASYDFAGKGMTLTVVFTPSSVQAVYDTVNGKRQQDGTDPTYRETRELAVTDVAEITAP